MYKSKFDDPSTHRAQPLGCASLFPGLRSEELAFRNGLEREEVEIGRIEINGVTPPLQFPTATGVDDSEEDNKSRNADTKVHGEREDIVVSHPPHEAESAEVELEDEADQ